ncbi:hypothetical protein Syun_017510 [Stephania yunnanensis]|uniref:Uncharacterized protein n=1 Tax=Stephania yunnanensis TaxID=152371 RepID=A0AAP0J760_9MAGN
MVETTLLVICGIGEATVAAALLSPPATVSTLLCSSALGMYYTRNTMMRITNVLVDSCDMKVDFGALGSVSVEEALKCLLKASMLSDLQSWTHWHHLPKDGKIIRINHSSSVDKFLDALLKGSSFQTTVKLLSLYASYGGKQHVPVSLLKSHAQRAMEVILKSSVDRAVVQSSCDELNGETIVCLPAFMHIKQKEGCSFIADVLLSGLRALTKEAPLVMLHACDKINARLMFHGIGFSLDIPEWVANDFFTSTDASMASETVARDGVRDPVECTDKNIDLVMHRDKDIDMFHLDWDFNVPVWAYGQPGLGGAYLVAEEPSLWRRSPALQSKMGVWPWASMALGGSGSFGGSTRRNVYIQISGGDSEGWRQWSRPKPEVFPGRLSILSESMDVSYSYGLGLRARGLVLDPSLWMSHSRKS